MPHVRASPPRANLSQESTQLISLLELTEAFLVLETFLKDQSHKVCSIDIGQLRCNSLCKQQGGHPLSPSDVLSLGNLDMVTSNRHPYFSSACSWKGNTIADPESRTLLDSTPSKSNHIFSNKLQRGSFRQPPNSKTTLIHKLANRSRSISYRCSNNSLEVSDGLCLPLLQSHSSSSQQGD